MLCFCFVYISHVLNCLSTPIQIICHLKYNCSSNASATDLGEKEGTNNSMSTRHQNAPERPISICGTSGETSWNQSRCWKHRSHFREHYFLQESEVSHYAIQDQSKVLGNSPMPAKQQKLHPSKVPGRETIEWAYSRVPRLQTAAWTRMKSHS
eukprot:TRINITY_DN14809_c0_g3_i1.p1 TRINITY_DN14809_c0_g3~~TRINITY_DN14809_c0_g3_i1.p1  ORF type:complete len:153 (+),score=21.70 TRINITY_DN14809_c0_g3_i1:644-1102(+)